MIQLKLHKNLPICGQTQKSQYFGHKDQQLPKYPVDSSKKELMLKKPERTISPRQFT